jgi:hypothetical protein
VRIRNYTHADLDALRRLHGAQSFGYPFPDLESPLFIAKLVLEDDEHADAPPGASDPVPNSEPASRSTDFSLWGFAAHSRDHVAAAENPQTEVCATQSNARGNSTSAQGREEADRDSLSAGHTLTQGSHVTMAVLLRLTAETYLLHDPHAGTPRQRWQHLLALHEAARRTAIARGLDDVQAFLPPRVARAFGRRLARLGWTQDPWPCFSILLGR